MNNITLDIKVQDELRRLFSQRGSTSGIKISNISLGDSDIDYEMSASYENIRSFNSPFKSYGIKHKLIYTGDINNVSGEIHANVVKIFKTPNNVVELSSNYNYPPDSITFFTKRSKPTLINANNFFTLLYTEPNTDGYVILPKTLIDNYTDSNGNLLQLKEPYTILNNNVPLIFDNNGFLTNPIESDIPTGWEIIYDLDNNSFSFLKPKTWNTLGRENILSIIGNESAIKKQLVYKY